ncbi:MAG: TonB-dependent siderophore receptor [Verrucomicrobiota bacterium]
MHLAPSLNQTSDKQAAANSSGAARGQLAKTLAFLPTLLAVGSLGAQTAEPAADATAGSDDQGDTPVALPEVKVEAARQPKLSSPKFTAPLLDTPQTVTVISREVFEQQGATTLRDVLRNTPGITFQAGEGGTASGDQMTIRGFSARNDILVDGVRDAGTYTRDAFNLEQVEVAKGPSSTNTGRGATGASINLVTKTPKLDNTRQASLGIGNADYRRATLDVNQTVSDTTAVRVNALWQEAGVPGRDVVENNQWAFAPSVAFGLGTDTRATVSYQHLEQDNIPDYGIPWVPTTSTNPAIGTPGGRPNVDQSNWYGLLDRDFEDIVNDTVGLNLERDLTPDMTLSNHTRFGRTERDSVITAPRFLVTGGVVQPQIRRSDEKVRDQVDDILANNLNLSASVITGPLDHAISTGVELSRERSKAYSWAPTVAPDPANPTDLFNPDPTDPNLAPLAPTGAVSTSDADTLGLYLMDTIELNEHWQIVGGVRWDRFDIDYTNAAGASFSRVDEVFSYKGGLIFKPVPNGSVFIGHGTSFTPSGDGLTLSATNSVLAPEEARSTEIGTKWDLFDRRLSLSAALFRTDKINAQSRDPITNVTSLAGDQRVQGLELGVSGFVTRHWNVFAGYAYQDSEVLSSANATEIGSALARTPEHSLNLWTAYELPFGLTVGGGAQ